MKLAVKVYDIAHRHQGGNHSSSAVRDNRWARNMGKY